MRSIDRRRAIFPGRDRRRGEKKMEKEDGRGRQTFEEKREIERERKRAATSREETKID